MVRTRSAAKKIENTLTNGGAVKRTAEDDAPPPVKKRRREDSAGPKKRRHRKPAKVSQLNLDVLFLVAAYDIHPLDLLNLARTCRSLRDLLMDKSSLFIWKTVFRKAKDVPPCPADMAEPEYANLIFYDHCQGCGRHTTTILWNVRRRYCPGCRIRHLRLLSSCNEIVRNNNVLAAEWITGKKGRWPAATGGAMRVARDKAASFMDEYRRASDKKQFIADKQKERRIIIENVKIYKDWHKEREIERKEDKKEIQRQRRESIFSRLREYYTKEINHFGYDRIRQSRESDFRSQKPLTDRGWQKIWPQWLQIMNEFREERLESTVYRPRRDVLVSAYRKFIAHPSSDAQTFDLLPHVGDIACFRPFLDVVEAPEKTFVDFTSFAPAFAQLPGLVTEWKMKLDAEIVQLAPSSICAGDLNRLYLASALFRTGHTGVLTCHEVFSVSMLDCRYPKDNSKDSGSISDQFGIQFFEEAPYIVHACGMNPNVATVDDMDHRNARLQCLVCEGRALVMNWKRAMWHASSCHQSTGLPPLSRSPRWRLVGDEHINTVQSVEQPVEGNWIPSAMRCLLCRHHVGDVIKMSEFMCHMHGRHHGYAKNLKVNDMKQGVHYAPIGILDAEPQPVEMVEEGGHIMFKALLK